MLEIATRLHPPHKVHSRTWAYLKHFENENLIGFVTLARKHVPMNIGPIAESPKLGDSIHDTKPSQVLEHGDFVFETRRIELLAAIKNEFKLFYWEHSRQVILIAEKVLTKEVLAGLHDNLVERCLGCPLNLLFNKLDDLLASTAVVTDLDRMTVVTKMDVGLLYWFNVVDVEDLGLTSFTTLKGLLADLVDESGSKWGKPTNNKGFVCKSFKLCTIDVWVWPSTSNGNRMGIPSPLKQSSAISKILGTAEVEAIEGIRVSDNDGRITRSREWTIEHQGLHNKHGDLEATI